MTLARWTGLVQDGAGNAVAGAQIEVRNEETGRLVPLFADRDGVNSLGNPFTAPEATVGFHAEGGAYRITATKGGELCEWRYVALGTAAEYDLDGLVFALSAGIFPAGTLADLQAYEPDEEGAISGVVYADPDPANNGYYVWEGGEWVKKRGFRQTFAEFTNLGGTANAQTGTLEPWVDPSEPRIYIVQVATDNTGPMTFNGTEVVNLVGNPLSAGEWTGVVLFIRDGDRYRLIIDAGAAASAAQSASEAAAEADRAEQEADRAESEADRAATNAMSVVDRAWFKNVADLQADDNSVIGYEGSEAQFIVSPGDPLEAQGFPYDVAPSDATDAPLKTEGDVYLFAVPTQHRFLTARQFGCTESSLENGDRLADAIGEAGTLGVPLLIDGHFRSGRQLETVADTVITFTPESASLTLTEDADVLINSQDFRLDVYHPRIINVVDVANRSLLNRGLRAVDSPGLFIHGDGYYEGWYAAAHALRSDAFVSTGFQHVKNLLGWAAQEGYGFNSGAPYTYIQHLFGDNSELALGDGNGRHVLYINDDVTNAYIGLLEAENIYFNPVNIKPQGEEDRVGKIVFDSVRFKNVNYQPPGLSSLGSGTMIQTSGEGVTKSSIQVIINNLFVDGYNGGIFSTTNEGGHDHSIIQNIVARNHLRTQVSANWQAFYFHNCVSPTVRNADIDILSHANSWAARFDNCDGFTAENIRVRDNSGGTVGSGIVRINSDVTGLVRLAALNGPEGLRRLRNDATEVDFDIQPDTKPRYTTGTSTPRVGLAKTLWTDETGRTFSNFLDGVEGQELIVTSTNGVTISASGNTNINSLSGNDISLGVNEFAGFVKRGTPWRQVW